MKRKSAILVVVLASISFFLMILIIWALMKTRPKPPEPPVNDPEEETVALQEEDDPDEEETAEQTPPDEDEPAEQTPPDEDEPAEKTPPDEEVVEEEPEEETGDGQVSEEDHNNDEEASGAIAEDPDEDSRLDTLAAADTEDSTGGGQGAAEKESAAEKEEEEAAAESTRSPFVIDPYQEESYSANLDPAEYLSYYSDTDDFFFSYPAHLYNRVVSDYAPFSTVGGENIETHTFYGSRGSQLSFQLTGRTDARNLSAVKDQKVRQEAGEITSELKTLLDETSRNGRFSRTVITGYDSSGWIVYKLIKVTPDHIMEMRILCPPSREGDDKDKYEKRYVQECIYRYCSFANDEIEPPRSYSDFLKDPRK